MHYTKRGSCYISPVVYSLVEGFWKLAGELSSLSDAMRGPRQQWLSERGRKAFRCVLARVVNYSPLWLVEMTLVFRNMLT